MRCPGGSGGPALRRLPFEVGTMTDDTPHDGAETPLDREVLYLQPDAPSTPTGQPDAPALDLKALREGGRGLNGKFSRGHLVNLKHALRVRPDHPDIVAVIMQRHAAIVVDPGDQMTATSRPRWGGWSRQLTTGRR